VSAGNGYACGVTEAGPAYCWGDNRDGQLGDGTRTNRWSPVLVAGGVHFASVSAGTKHTCGVTRAGDAYCWGDNRGGQLGDGTTMDQLTPVRVVQ
jgi:alpha-tubulin suppressor-like RCC1 family protein